ncbi:hypothetical protein E2320_008254 [Naja naja]|nr:hypothetical protein E2320_008254 [Naja naja]
MDLKVLQFSLLLVLLGPKRTVVGHKIFKMEERQGTFQRAKIVCDDNLALPRNNAENQALEDLLRKTGQTAILGITYNAAGNKFEDLNGQPLQFFNWAPGEPNILGGGKCVTINTEGKWHVEDCLYERTIICELALEVSLQETSTSSTSPQDWLQNACTLIMCAPNKGDPRREMAIQGLQQFSSPSELLALSAPNRDKLGTGTSAILAPNGRIVGDKMFKRDDSKGDFLAATTKCTHMNSKLALPRNVAENSALQEIVAFRNEQTILGITYNAAKRKFEDLNGHPLQFSNWAPGEPNNLGYEKCVEMHPNGQWHNRICDLGWSIICEVDI